VAPAVSRTRGPGAAAAVLALRKKAAEVVAVGRGSTGLLTYSLESTQPQVLELLGESYALLGSERPELIADYATSLDRPIAVDTSEKAPRAISQL
jgi:hypothetical protein